MGFLLLPSLRAKALARITGGSVDSRMVLLGIMALLASGIGFCVWRPRWEWLWIPSPGGTGSGSVFIWPLTRGLIILKLAFCLAKAVGGVGQENDGEHWHKYSPPRTWNWRGDFPP